MSLFRETFGGLITRLRSSVAVPDNLGVTLHEALTRRNWLGHNYFWDRAVQFMTEQGRTSMIDELQRAADDFEQLDQQLTRISREWADQHGITDQMIQEQIENLVQDLNNS
jgi:hypothetical protein